MAIRNEELGMGNEKISTNLPNYSSTNLTYLAGEEIKKISPLVPYSDEVCNFLSDFSAELLKDSRYRNFPDAATVGFF